MRAWLLVPYRTAAGRCPFEDYLDGLSTEDATRMEHELDLLAEFGVALGMPHVRPVADELWELRVRGRVQHRVLYVTISGRRIVLLHAFVKKTAQTPRREIKIALDRLADFRERGQA